ncbi:uncharacterized protein METZ01_LOCUS167721, partial [marine metagenome]
MVSVLHGIEGTSLDHDSSVHRFQMTCLETPRRTLEETQRSLEACQNLSWAFNRDDYGVDSTGGVSCRKTVDFESDFWTIQTPIAVAHVTRGLPPSTGMAQRRITDIWARRGH